MLPPRPAPTPYPFNQIVVYASPSKASPGEILKIPTAIQPAQVFWLLARAVSIPYSTVLAPRPCSPPTPWRVHRIAQSPPTAPLLPFPKSARGGRFAGRLRRRTVVHGMEVWVCEIPHERI